MILLKGGLIYKNDKLINADILIDDGNIISIGNITNETATTYDITGKLVIAGAVDVHAHLRQPGYEHKETIKSGTLSAAKGGITTIMSMPNLIPVPDTQDNLNVQQQIINNDAVINVFPYAPVTMGQKGKELAGINTLLHKVKGFSDDGVPVENMELLGKAMQLIGNNNIIASHAEAFGCDTSEESEYLAVKQELETLKKYPCKYHFCHMSTQQSFDLIRQAQKDGFDVTCEVMPHHLFLDSSQIKDSNWKMNPPLRTKADRLATMQALLDGTATIIATDHAPHSQDEKSCEYDKAPNGIIGFETMLPLIYTYLVRNNIATIGQMINWVTINPAKRFNLPCGSLTVGGTADLAIMDITNPHTYTKEEILSKSKNSPFIGNTLYGFVVLTLCGGKVVYKQCSKQK